MKSPAPGVLIDDSLLVEELIGKGGMGSVYRAKHLGLGRTVALKLMPELHMANEESRQRFKREARVLSLLSHKNVVGFFSFGLWQDEVPYMAMELLNGRPLDELILERKLSGAEIRDLLLQVCSALDYAHRQGVVHRDLKPANIIVVQEPEPDTVKIVDFGLAKFLPEKVEVSQNLTETGLLIGSVNYMSPEQCLAKSIDERSDIYSLGCVLYQMLSGKAPFDQENPMAIVHRQLSDDLPFEDLPAGSAEVQDLISIARNCTNKDPQKRYQSAAALQEDLQRVGSRRINEFVAKAANPPSKKAILSLSFIFCLLCLAGYYFTDNYLPVVQAEFIKRFGDQNSCEAAIVQAGQLRERGRMQAAVDLLQAALFVANKYKLNDIGVAEIDKELARTYEEMDMKDPALKYASEALKNYTTVLSKESWPALKSQNYSQEFQDCLQLLGGLHPDLQSNKTKIESILSRLEAYQDFDTALMLAKFQVELASTNTQTDHHESRERILAAQRQLAACYYKAGRLQDACSEMKQILNKAQQMHSSQELSQGLNQYVDYLGELEKPALLPFGKVCEQMLEEESSMDDLHKVNVVQSLCHFYIKCGDTANAEVLKEKAYNTLLDAKELKLYPDSMWDKYLTQSELCCLLGDTRAALEAFGKAVGFLETFQHKTSWYVECSMSKISSSCLHELEDKKEVFALLERLEKLAEKASARDDSLLLCRYRTYLSLGDYNKAKELDPKRFKDYEASLLINRTGK